MLKLTNCSALIGWWRGFKAKEKWKGNVTCNLDGGERQTLRASLDSKPLKRT